MKTRIYAAQSVKGLSVIHTNANIRVNLRTKMIKYAMSSLPKHISTKAIAKETQKVLKLLEFFTCGADFAWEIHECQAVFPSNFAPVHVPPSRVYSLSLWCVLPLKRTRERICTRRRHGKFHDDVPAYLI